MWNSQSSSPVAAFASRLSKALTTCSYNDASGVSDLLSLRYKEGDGSMDPIENPDQRTLESLLESPWDAIARLHLRVVWLISQRKLEDAFGTQAQLIGLMAREVIQKQKDENWFLPVVYAFCADLRLLAKAVDAAAGGVSAGEASFLEQSETAIKDVYRNCINDIRAASVDVSKRLAILNLTNQLFRIYFRINKLNMLKPLIRAVENCGSLYEHFSMADKVTYKYYLGRKAMFDADLQSAEENLSFAFKHTAAVGHRKNQRLILMYLIPVKMFLGHMPTEELLARNQLQQFVPVADAVKQGNLGKLDAALEEHQAFFIKCGIFLMLEKLKIITYRNLFKKVATILDSHQIELEIFVRALKATSSAEEGDEVDEAEVACILSNLIFEGKIKGYISHQHKKLVISKAVPFPPLSSI